MKCNWPFAFCFLQCCLFFFAVANVGFAEAAVHEPVAAPVPHGVEKPVAVKRLTANDLDHLIEAEQKSKQDVPLISDELFLRRASLDVIGRQPAAEELDAFLADDSPGKRSRTIDRLLASKEFGRNWADYWSDTISYHVPQPELTFLNYDLFKVWLADELNNNTGWNDITTQILTATGKVKENPAATFIGFHQANPTRLASETTRVFLGLQIQCAECHDHPFEDWKREQFHQMAAFFVRASAKLPRNDSNGIVVSSKEKGEYRMPDAIDPLKKGRVMAPSFLTENSDETGAADDVRRRRLAKFITGIDNPWFAEAFVNRVWARLMGQGFYEPIDDIGGHDVQSLPTVHAALAGDFRNSGFNVKDVYRVVMNSRAYQAAVTVAKDGNAPRSGPRATKLRGDEVFRSLETAIKLPNIRLRIAKATKAVRFPVPPKSTQETITETFGYDPSRSADSITRTMSQAMLLMNNKQLLAQINAKPSSGTVLSKLLAAEKDDRTAFRKLFRLVMARNPTEREVGIAVEHVDSLKDRGAAFEDLLWSLINSAEFTIKR